MTQLIAILLVGAPGSGKSTWGMDFASENVDFVRLCPDEFRAKFGSSEADQTVSEQAFKATRDGMEQALKNNKNVIVDATNMYRNTRQQFLQIAKRFNAETVAMVFEADKQTLLDRNKQRGKLGGRDVPEFVIDKMLSKYQRPNESEFDSVKFITKLS